MFFFFLCLLFHQEKFFFFKTSVDFDTSIDKCNQWLGLELIA